MKQGHVPCTLAQGSRKPRAPPQSSGGLSPKLPLPHAWRGSDIPSHTNKFCRPGGKALTRYPCQWQGGREASAPKDPDTSRSIQGHLKTHRDTLGHIGTS